MQSDPLLEIAKSQEGGGYSLVYRSQPLMKTLNPRSVHIVFFRLLSIVIF